MNPEIPLDQRIEAHLALLLPTPTPQGAPPTLEEIDAWQRQLLPAARAAEVLAYVACDPVYYQQWYDLRQAAAEPKVPIVWMDVLAVIRNAITQWLRELSNTPMILGGGLATACVLMLVVLLPRPETPEWERILTEDQTTWENLAASPPTAWPWQGNTNKGTGKQSITPEQQSFQVGIKAALATGLTPGPAQLAIMQGLATELGHCTKATAQCTQRQHMIKTLGNWVTLAHLACMQGLADPTQLTQRLIQWATLAKTYNLELWQELLGDGVQANTESPPCTQVREILIMGLLPLNTDE